MHMLTVQLIFRKVADVKKEHELSERQKNEAPLDLPSDHPPPAAPRLNVPGYRTLDTNFTHDHTLMMVYTSRGGVSKICCLPLPCYFAGPTRLRSIVMSVGLCLSVCLSVCPLS